MKRLQDGISEIEAEIADLSSQIREGHKFVPMQVESSIDFEQKQKYYTLPGETNVLLIESLESADYQLRFLFPGEKNEMPEQIGDIIKNEFDFGNPNGEVTEEVVEENQDEKTDEDLTDKTDDEVFK